MYKVAYFRGETEAGPTVLPLFGPADGLFEKVAAPQLLPDVIRYITTLRPRNDAQYVLVNALGASEWWGANVNADGFPEAALIHAPDDWKGVPLLDQVKAKDWPYGYPTFYDAKPFLHHRNKPGPPHNHPSFGEVELATWNDRMKRVELVLRIDKDLCERGGGTGLWDKLRAGQYCDVSMGSKVPFDTCSICLDWDAYRKAQATFDPSHQKTPGDAVLAVHKKKLAKDGIGIRGVSITRKDYCKHMREMPNRILPDGRKVFVYNDYPKFFDISFVFVGADKTAKVLMKIADDRRFWSLGGAELAEKLGYAEALLVEETEKTASVDEDQLKTAFLGKRAVDKQGEIVKDVVPSQFASKAVPLLTKEEKDLPRDLLDILGTAPIESSLSTPSAMGMVLRPREFQRVMLIQVGRRDLADDFDRKGVVFPQTNEKESVPMGPSFFSPVLAKLLSSLMGERSGLGPAIEKRVLIIQGKSPEQEKRATSHSSPLLRKISAVYNGYRQNVMELVTNSQDLLSSMGTPSIEGLDKFASCPVEEVFTPLSVAYLQSAFLDEVGGEEKTSGVERALPSKNTWAMYRSVTGGR